MNPCVIGTSKIVLLSLFYIVWVEVAMVFYAQLSVVFSRERHLRSALSRVL